MRYIKLTEDEKVMLEEAHKNHSLFHVRDISKAILLSHDQVRVKEIASYFNVRTRTIYTWMDRWTKEGYLGLTIKSGRGCKPKLKMLPEIIEVVKKKRQSTHAV